MEIKETLDEEYYVILSYFKGEQNYAMFLRIYSNNIKVCNADLILQVDGFL